MSILGKIADRFDASGVRSDKLHSHIHDLKENTDKRFTDLDSQVEYMALENKELKKQMLAIQMQLAQVKRFF